MVLRKKQKFEYFGQKRPDTFRQLGEVAVGGENCRELHADGVKENDLLEKNTGICRKNVSSYRSDRPPPLEVLCTAGERPVGERKRSALHHFGFRALEERKRTGETILRILKTQGKKTRLRQKETRFISRHKSLRIHYIYYMPKVCISASCSIFVFASCRLW